MKGLVLAGGTGSRLHPLTLVTNKHLLPVHDRPMIYYPLATLADMGIREVMVILGGRSIGDIVELLSSGQEHGLDLSYRYQRGSLGIAHAIGLCRAFVGEDSFCVVLGDNILLGEALAEAVAEFADGPWGAGTLLYRVPDAGRFGCGRVRCLRGRRRLQGEAEGAQERFDHPRLLPATRCLRCHRAPGALRAWRVRDHRCAQHYIGSGGLFAQHYEGQWADAGTIEALLESGTMVASSEGLRASSRPMAQGRARC